MTKRSPDTRPPISASTRPISGRPWARQSDSSGLRDQPYQLDFPLTSPAAVEPHVRLGLGRDKPADTCLALGLIRADRTDVSGSAGREGARSSARRGEPGLGLLRAEAGRGEGRALTSAGLLGARERGSPRGAGRGARRGSSGLLGAPRGSSGLATRRGAGRGCSDCSGCPGLSPSPPPTEEHWSTVIAAPRTSRGLLGTPGKPTTSTADNANRADNTARPSGQADRRVSGADGATTVISGFSFARGTNSLSSLLSSMATASRRVSG